jgi:hypothetical protein
MHIRIKENFPEKQGLDFSEDDLQYFLTIRLWIDMDENIKSFGQNWKKYVTIFAD